MTNYLFSQFGIIIFDTHFLHVIPFASLVYSIFLSPGNELDNWSSVAIPLLIIIPLLYMSQIRLGYVRYCIQYDKLVSLVCSYVFA